MICSACQRQQAAAVKGNRWTCYHGKSEDVLATLESGSVDAIVTDPPYGTGANGAASRTAPTSTKYRNTGAAKLPDFAGDSMLPEAWAAMMAKVWRECYRVAADGAVVLAFCDWRAFHAMLSQITSVGFQSRGVVVWDKGRGSRASKNGFRSQSEFVLFATKGKIPERATAFYGDGVLKFSTMTGGKQHITQKPLPLMAELLGCVPPNSLIVDPFQGSGTTGVAAIANGHRYVGCEETAEYHAIAVERLQKAETCSL